MRVGAQWIWSEEGWDDVDSEPAWLGIGWITGDAGGLLILIAVILAGLGARRLRQGGGTSSGLVRFATVLTAIALLSLLTGLAASLGPARRALRIQPTEALRD